MKELENCIQNYFGVEVADLSSVAKLFKNTKLIKGEYLLKIDQYARNIHFVKTRYI